MLLLALRASVVNAIYNYNSSQFIPLLFQPYSCFFCLFVIDNTQWENVINIRIPKDRDICIYTLILRML